MTNTYDVLEVQTDILLSYFFISKQLILRKETDDEKTIYAFYPTEPFLFSSG